MTVHLILQILWKEINGCLTDNGMFFFINIVCCGHRENEQLPHK